MEDCNHMIKDMEKYIDIDYDRYTKNCRIRYDLHEKLMILDKTISENYQVIAQLMCNVRMKASQDMRSDVKNVMAKLRDHKRNIELKNEYEQKQSEALKNMRECLNKNDQ